MLSQESYQRYAFTPKSKSVQLKDSRSTSIMKKVVIWDMVPCEYCRNQHFPEHKATEDDILHSHRCQNLKL
jgi:hypothetical protein